ncbi:MAG: hypothetical protein HC846_03320 [Blastocatellia bacterium]|nr:hypothetical protein [Blastocatellia bacterium]
MFYLRNNCFGFARREKFQGAIENYQKALEIREKFFNVDNKKCLCRKFGGACISGTRQNISGARKIR